MNKRKNTFVSAGISSILLVFVLLCLITFAVLSLTSANADYKLSQKSAQRTRRYYDAQTAAAERLKEIDGVLWEQYNNSKDQDEFEENVLLAFDAEENVSAEETEDGIRISFSQDIGEEEQLEAELAVCYPKEEGSSLFRVLRWKSVQNAQWEPDTSLPVLQQPG